MDEQLRRDIYEELEEWIESRPPAVAALIRRCPPDRCYRLEGDRLGHYAIASYSEPEDGSELTVRLEHLSDSLMPGVVVFGIDPDRLIACNCRTMMRD